MKFFPYTFSLFLLIIFSSRCYAFRDNDKHVAGAGVSGIATALSRADVALANSKIVLNHLKGDFGESIYSSFLNKPGWRPATFSFGRQGLDHVSIKYNSSGRPTSLMVSEVKYGTSKLSQTKDGIQAGRRWTSKRLVALGNRYVKAGSARITQVQRRPYFGKANHQIEVTLKSGKKATLWRADSKDTWKFDGRLDDLEEAQRLAKRDGSFLKAGGEHRITVRRRLVSVKKISGNYEIKIGNASLLDDGQSFSQIMKDRKIHKIAVNSEMSKADMAKDISQQLKKKLPNLPKKELDSISKEIARGGNLDDAGASFSKTVSMNSLKAGITGGLFFAGMEGVQQAVSGDFDPIRLGTFAGIGTVSTGLGTLTGQIVTARLINLSITKTAASKIGLSTPFLSNTLGVASGAIGANLLISYGLYFSGYATLEEAHMIAGIGTVSIGAGALASSGLFGVATIIGTAGTGTAISTLSGAAANSATLAWLGGGSMATGSIVIVVVPIAVAIVFAYGIAKMIEWNDDDDHQEYTNDMLDYLLDPSQQPFKLHVESVFPITGN